MPIGKTKLLFLGLFPVALVSCVKTYYMSPMYGNSMPYHTLPLHKDSIKNAFYGNASVMYGGNNYNWNDDEFAVHANVYNANSFNVFCIWYGGGLTLGNYFVRRFDSALHPAFNAAALNKVTGHKSFGSINTNAGIAISVPLGDGEWRALGVQGSFQKEFGEYSDFREKIAR